MVLQNHDVLGRIRVNFCKLQTQVARWGCIKRCSQISIIELKHVTDIKKEKTNLSCPSLLILFTFAAFASPNLVLENLMNCMSERPLRCKTKSRINFYSATKWEKERDKRKKTRKACR